MFFIFDPSDLMNANSNPSRLTLTSLLIRMAIVLGISMLACGDNLSDEEAMEKCEAFIDAYCEKEASCSLFTSMESCESQVRTDLDCGAAVGVSESYDRCLEDIERSSCSTFGIPASCEGAILVR